ncbi:unnamed protein product (macronuclear) [Paramecium tetraurelia]|uniref:Transmembrane protein n=1 Tax=Paramecium tetraurelia TaxID=5888 RepID=A0DMJ3_PARTE|nr:uncharacterized protein GSPATT00018478001 [Paramecium tetraurelia]CAK84260.1 unnamed protein product [Paramecium tetraurelia]|eukprot:XP_001451657.1 hypothetical protein (macronuclear) [Paramecium tetraurelia strain d4-2]
MQFSADPQYYEMSKYPNNLGQQTINPVMNPSVPQANLSPQVNISSENDPASPEQTRQAFLVKYYVKQIIQLAGIILIYGINQINAFSSIYLTEVDREWWGSKYTYESFSQNYHRGATRREFEDWMEERRRDYMDYKFNWVYYFILSLTLCFTVFLAFARNSKSFARNQNTFFMIQTVFLGIVLGGLSSVHQQNWLYHNTIIYILLTLFGLMANSIFNLVLIKLNKLQIYGKLPKTFTYLFFGLNFLMGFREYQMVEALPIVEFITIYCFFYFDQLNKSLLVQPSELPPTTNIVDLLRNIKTELEGNQFQSNQHFIVINKKVLTIVSIGVGLILLEVFGFLMGTFIFIVVSILSVLTGLSFAVPTQVAQQTLTTEDSSIAVMMTYLDLLCPIQNIIRSIKI